MSNVQRKTTEQQGEAQGRILGRKLGREINPEQAMQATGGVQCLSGVYDRHTGKYLGNDDASTVDA